MLTDNLAALFRNVPPALALALAQTEKDEKAARAQIMRRERCSEVGRHAHRRRDRTATGGWLRCTAPFFSSSCL